MTSTCVIVDGNDEHKGLVAFRTLEPEQKVRAVPVNGIHEGVPRIIDLAPALIHMQGYVSFVVYGTTIWYMVPRYGT